MRHLKDRRLWQLILIAMLIPLALIAFWPTPVDKPMQGLLADTLMFLHSHGVPRWLNYGFIEAAANIALFVPLGTVCALAFPKFHWWRIGGVGFLFSMGIELGQLLFLSGRFASPLDVIANTAGAVIGAFFAKAASQAPAMR